MSKLGRCRSCKGFVPGRAEECPHCGGSVANGAVTKLGALGAALGGGAIAFTLMACYGMPPCPDGTRDCHRPASPPAAGDAGADDPAAAQPSATPPAR